MSWVAAAVIGGGALALGGGAMAASASGKEERHNDWLANPEYPHSQDARDLWWKKLEDWSSDPNYGAISPDWDNIWNMTQQKVKEYYRGGPLTPGAKGRLKSALARRNMSENPASDFLNAQIDAQEAQDLGSLAAQQSIAKNEFTERGRGAWLDSLEGFQAQKPAGQWDTYMTDPGAKQKAWGNLLSSTGTGIATMGMDVWSQNKQLDFLREQRELDRQMMYNPWGY